MLVSSDRPGAIKAKSSLGSALLLFLPLLVLAPRCGHSRKLPLERATDKDLILPLQAPFFHLRNNVTSHSLRNPRERGLFRPHSIHGHIRFIPPKIQQHPRPSILMIILQSWIRAVSRIPLVCAPKKIVAFERMTLPLWSFSVPEDNFIRVIMGR